MNRNYNMNSNSLSDFYMKKQLFNFLVLALFFSMCFTMTSCGDGNDDSDGLISNTNGRLTITGLGSSNNGKYVVANAGDQPDDSWFACEEMINISPANSSGGLITGGSVTLKVWKFNGVELMNYSGYAEDLIFHIFIKETQTFLGSDISMDTHAGTVTVSFNNGIASGIFVGD